MEDHMNSTHWLDQLLTSMGSIKSGRKHQCPGHALTGLHSQSLALSASDTGHALLYCHAGCDLKTVLGALRLPHSVLRDPMGLPPRRWHEIMLPGKKFPPPRNDGGSLVERGFRYETEHQYGPDCWKIRYRHRSGAKEIQWESLNPHGERVLGLLGRKERDLPLYREREVLMAIAMDELIVLVESESSVDALNAHGLYATTWAGGAGSVPTETVEAVLGPARVLYVPDNDEAGDKSVPKVQKALPNIDIRRGHPGDDAKDILLREGPAWFAEP